MQVRPVEIASQQGETAVISKGLAPGDRVVTDGANQLRPGSKVSTKADDEKKKKGNGGVPGAPGAAPTGTPSAAPAAGHP